MKANRFNQNKSPPVKTKKTKALSSHANLRLFFTSCWSHLIEHKKETLKCNTLPLNCQQ